MRDGLMEIVDCNNHVKSTIKFFGPSCAVNSLINKYNPLGDNSDQLCRLCVGKVPGGKCTNADPYSGYEGAFRCLVEAGEIAFLVHSTVQEMTATNFDFSEFLIDLCYNIFYMSLHLRIHKINFYQPYEIRLNLNAKHNNY